MLARDVVVHIRRVFYMLNLVRHDVLYSKFAVIAVFVFSQYEYRAHEQDQQRILHLPHFTVGGTSILSAVYYYHNRAVEWNKLGISISLEGRDGFGHHLVAPTNNTRARFSPRPWERYRRRRPMEPWAVARLPLQAMDLSCYWRGAGTCAADIRQLQIRDRAACCMPRQVQDFVGCMWHAVHAACTE